MTTEPLSTTVARGSRRAACALLRTPSRLFAALFVSAACAAPNGARAAPAPAPAIQAASWLVVDADSGKTLGAHNVDARREPASLTKLMTAYVAFDALERDALRWDDTVTVAADDIASVGRDEARMYLTPGQRVRVRDLMRDLMRGLIVASANDAALVLAKRIGGSPAGFATMMNDTARRLGMRDSHFVSPSGITTPDHYSTAHDLSILAQRLNRDFPAFYTFSSQRHFAYGAFAKTNKNRLLGADPSVDGMKTGHTNAAGWCMVVTAKRPVGGARARHRVIAVLLGEPTEKQRLADARALLDQGFASLGADAPAANAVQRANARPGEHRAQARARML